MTALRPDVTRSSFGEVIEHTEQFGPFVIAQSVRGRDWLLGYLSKETITINSYVFGDKSTEPTLFDTKTEWVLDWEWSCSEPRVRAAAKASEAAGRLIVGLDL